MLVQAKAGTIMQPRLPDRCGHFPLTIMKPSLPVLLLGLAAGSAISCKGPTPPPSTAKPAAGTTPPPAALSEPDWRSSYWQRAMAHYKPPAEGDFVTTPELEAPPADGATTPVPAATSSASTPAPESPPAPKPPPLVPADLPFGTRIPGQPGLVKSPYDPDGRSVDVREFAPGQMARCPYSGKVFRVPPR